jgi:hypothetical protein
MPAVDVVTVPDFTGPAAPRFELRTLLFLGSWLSHQGASRAWTVHLACVGDPPVSVRRMAAFAGAEITRHAPVDPRWPRSCNKLRAFEIARGSPMFLLLDTDTLVLRDLAPLLGAVGDRTALGPATFNPVPEHMWRRIFELADAPYPGPAGSIPPYYNSGVVMGAWAHDLGARWTRHLDRLLSAADDAFWNQVPRSRRFADQYALATAAAALVASGGTVIHLPPQYHVRPPLLDAGAVSWRETALLHYPRMLVPYGETVETVAAWLYGARYGRVRRLLSRWLGLRVVRAPILRDQPRARRGWWGAFAQRVHAIVQEFGPRW